MDLSEYICYFVSAFIILRDFLQQWSCIKSLHTIFLKPGVEIKNYDIEHEPKHQLDEKSA